jgi:acyl-CoA synthetase (NDP forming)
MSVGALEKVGVPVQESRPEAGGLTRLLHPRAIAVIGASPDSTKLAGRPLAYLRKFGFDGVAYPVNPKHAAIGGVRCYASVTDLPDGIDLALILLPASGVAESLQACGERGIPFAISIAGGFAEAGAAEEQQRLVDICRRTGIRLIGPNCVGLLNPRFGVTATFSTVLKDRMPRPGSIALLTQSGALGNSLLQSFNDLDLGLATWVSTGNEADLGVLELVEHFIHDDTVKLIVLFVEGLKNGDQLLPLARRAHAAGKTIAVLRAGRSQLGRAASISHTGKLAGAWKVWRDVARQAGMIEIESLDDLLDLAIVFDVAGDPSKDAASGLGVLTISGGLGVLISDAAAECDLPLPSFSAETQARLRSILPPQMAVANPVDTALFTDELGYAKCADAVLADSSIGTLLLILTSLAHDYMALLPWLETLGQQAERMGKHVAVSFLSSSDQLAREPRQRLLAAGVVVLPTAERLVAAMGRRRNSMWPRQAVHRFPVAGAARDKVYEQSAAAFLDRAQVPLVPERTCQTVQEAQAFAASTGYPVVLKVVSPDLPHKSEAGGVALNLADAPALASAWTTMHATVAERAPRARIEGYAVQPQLSDGLEMIVGCSEDPEVGRVVMVGAGGIWAEMLDDVRFLGLPATDDEIRTALLSLRVAPLFAGARGKPALDLNAAIGVVSRLARCFHEETWVKEVDLNPMLVRPLEGGAIALDVLVVTGTSAVN